MQSRLWYVFLVSGVRGVFGCGEVSFQRKLMVSGHISWFGGLYPFSSPVLAAAFFGIVFGVLGVLISAGPVFSRSPEVQHKGSACVSLPGFRRLFPEVTAKYTESLYCQQRDKIMTANLREHQSLLAITQSVTSNPQTPSPFKRCVCLAPEMLKTKAKPQARNPQTHKR